MIWAAKEVSFPQVGKLFGFVKVLASTMLQKLGWDLIWSAFFPPCLCSIGSYVYFVENSVELIWEYVWVFHCLSNFFQTPKFLCVWNFLDLHIFSCSWSEVKKKLPTIISTQTKKLFSKWLTFAFFESSILFLFLELIQIWRIDRLKAQMFLAFMGGSY